MKLKLLCSTFILSLCTLFLHGQNLTADAGADTVYCEDVPWGDSVTLQGSATGGIPPYAYRWYTDPYQDSTFQGTIYTSDWLSDTTHPDPILYKAADMSEPRTFYLEIIDSMNDTATDSVEIKICGMLPIPLGCPGIYPTVGDTVTLFTYIGSQCVDSIAWFPQTNIVSSPNETEIQVIVDDVNFNSMDFTVELYNEYGCVGQYAICPVVAAVYPLAVEEMDQRRVKVYPNPAADMLQLESSSSIQNVILQDVTGRTVLNSRQWTLDVSSMPPGLYFLTVHFADGSAEQLEVMVSHR